ncbi:MAG: histidinol dehydrogenase [Planctomycetota bacterium]
MSDVQHQALRRLDASEVRREARPPVDAETLVAAQDIVERVRREGLPAVRELAERFGERTPDAPLYLDRSDLWLHWQAQSEETRGVLERVASRIEAFARAQRSAIAEVDIAIDGGRAGHTIEPIAAAGCYAPGGRYPLPSTALMTAVTARVAGCERVVVASPAAHPLTCAAAYVAGADGVLAIGGAHAIAALAYGFEGFDQCDVIVGPGNRWVTAAKQLVSGVVGIDMLAGPSELLVIADASADADVVAADLLAQAEHDTDASAVLVSTSSELVEAVDRAIARRLAELPTAETARVALQNGFACVVPDLDAACRVADWIAPEHLEILTEDPDRIASKIRNAGGVFIGARSAEVFGDYGAGPNHTLPTGGTARFQAGLSVTHFLRLRTWLRMADAEGAVASDAQGLAELEGLAGHAASARARRSV